MTRILALDPAALCGWAHFDGKTITSGTWTLHKGQNEANGMRLLRLKTRLSERLDSGVDLVVYEYNPFLRGRNAVQRAGEMAGVIKVWCEGLGLNYADYSAAAVKEYATGKKKADKDAMVHACIHKFGIEPTDDNEADAVALLNLAMSEYGGAA